MDELEMNSRKEEEMKKYMKLKIVHPLTPTSSSSPRSSSSLSWRSTTEQCESVEREAK
jgi:hypothetical protein